MKPSNNFRRRERILIKRVDAENGARHVDEHEESHLGKFHIGIVDLLEQVITHYSSHRRGFPTAQELITKYSSSRTQNKLRKLMKKEFASPSGSVRPGTQCKRSWASPEDLSPSTKINLIIDFSRRRISEIKLKRTDTTLDLSQEAKRAEEEKKKKREKLVVQIYIGSDVKC